MSNRKSEDDESRQKRMAMMKPFMSCCCSTVCAHELDWIDMRWRFACVIHRGNEATRMTKGTATRLVDVELKNGQEARPSTQAE